jgi:predicted alpha/beta hydrolase family esterase
VNPTVLIVPGLRDHVGQHWQTLLADQLPDARTVPPMGREDLDCARRVAAIEDVAREIAGPLLVVAHSGGVVTVAHWARQTRSTVTAALLAVPPDFETPMPEGYPTIDALRAGGWLPVPRERLPFRSYVCASTDDPLARIERVEQMAHDWGSTFVNLGPVGHLNPASGYGPWPAVRRWVDSHFQRAA